jgi:hypothetical protein
MIKRTTHNVGWLISIISNSQGPLVSIFTREEILRTTSCNEWCAAISTHFINNYEGRLKSSWTHVITPSRNFVEVRWRSLFRSTSLGKRCTSYNAPPTYRKRAEDLSSLRNFLPWSSVFIVRRAQKPHGPGETWTVWRMFWWGSTDPLFPGRT